MVVWDISCLHNQYIHLQHLTAAFIFRVTVSNPTIWKFCFIYNCPSVHVTYSMFLDFIFTQCKTRYRSPSLFHFLVPSLASYIAYRMPCLPSFSTYSSHLYSHIQVELNQLFLWSPLSEVSRCFFATGSDSISLSHIEFTLSSQ